MNIRAREGVGIAPVCALNVTRMLVVVAVGSLGSQSKLVASENIVSPILGCPWL